MRGGQWLKEREADWRRLEKLLSLTGGAIRRLHASETRELGLLYLNVLNDLARVQSDPTLRHLAPYLNQLAQRCHARVYEQPPTSWRDIARFFRVDFPCCFRRNILYIAAAFLLFTLGSGVAMLTVYFHPETENLFLPPALIARLDQGMLWTDATQAAPSESTFLMTNNIQVAINAFAYGILLGVGTLLILFYNGMGAFGGPLQVCIQHGMGLRLLQFMMAHAPIELTTIFIAGGAGMMIGFAILLPGDLPRRKAIGIKSREALRLILGCFPLLMIAGLIEGMVSLNRAAGLEIRVGIAALSILALIGYLGFSGRGQAAPLLSEPD